MGLFEGINFYIAEKSVKDASEVSKEDIAIPSRYSPLFLYLTQLKNVLVSGGGQREFYPSELVSHVITDTLPPPNLGLSRCTTSIMLHVSIAIKYYSECMYIVLTYLLQSEWVYMSSRCGVILPYPTSYTSIV